MTSSYSQWATTLHHPTDAKTPFKIEENTKKKSSGGGKRKLTKPLMVSIWALYLIGAGHNSRELDGIDGYI